MNRTMNHEVNARGAWGREPRRVHTKTYEGDYLVELLRRIVAFLCSAQTKTALTALSIVSVVLLTLGIAGGVEHGILSIECLLPMAGVWCLVALLLHRARK